MSSAIKKRTQSVISKPDFFDENEFARTMGTGFSTLHRGQIRLDPSIRRLQEEALARNRGLFDRSGTALDDFLAKQRGLRQRFEGNRGALTQAFVNPILQARESTLGATRRQQNLRNIAGSSIASSELAGLRGDFAIQEADARARGEYASLEALTGIDQNMIGAAFTTIAQQAALNGETMDIAKTRLAQELQGLGLAQNQINAMIQAFEGQQNRAFAERKAIANTITSFFGMNAGQSPNLGSQGNTGLGGSDSTSQAASGAANFAAFSAIGG